MTPKEKAQEIFIKYYENIPRTKWAENYQLSKQCALIAVDEIIEATSIKYEFRDAQIFYAGKKPMQYWLDVKNEIDKL